MAPPTFTGKSREYGEMGGARNFSPRPPVLSPTDHGARLTMSPEVVALIVAVVFVVVVWNLL